MWKLTIEDDEGKQTSLPLAHDEYGVGRAEDNAIRLTDRNVSRKHASLRRNGAGWYVKDLASYNGTYVNGARVSNEQLVGNGDVVQLGDYRLELCDESVSPAVYAGFVVDPTPPPGSSSPSIHQRPDRFVVVVGPSPGAEYPLDRDHFTIGRAEDATISINHGSVSRLHAELFSLGHGRYEIVDKQSANGIRINGVDLKRGILEAGDALELGDVRLRFVGAGKLFRSGADQSQQLQAVQATFDVVPSTSRPEAVPLPPITPGRASAAGKYIGLGALLGVGLIVGLLMLMRTPSSPKLVEGITPASAQPAAATDPPTDVATRLLAEAKRLVQSGDLEAAHRSLLQIPENAPARDDPSFKEIEARWAETMFAKASDPAIDGAEQRRIYAQILATPTLAPETRKRASELLAALDAPVVATTTPRVPPASQPSPIPVSAGPPAPRTTSSDVAPVAPSTPGVMDDETTRRTLLPKAWAGKASEIELRMLKAACRNLGDQSCKAKAQQMLDSLKK